MLPKHSLVRLIVPSGSGGAPHIISIACRRKWKWSWFTDTRWKQIRPKPHRKLFTFIACDTFDGWRLWCLSGARWHLDVHVWPRSWSRAAKQRWWENPRPSTTRDHLGIRCYFASLFHVQRLCAPSVCRLEWQLSDGFPLRTWHITLMPGRPAGWEKTAAARHSSQPHQSPRRQTWRPWAPLKNLFADIFSFCHPAERSWLTDWVTDWGGKLAERQAMLQFDG